MGVHVEDGKSVCGDTHSGEEDVYAEDRDELRDTIITNRTVSTHNQPESELSRSPGSMASELDDIQS